MKFQVAFILLLVGVALAQDVTEDKPVCDQEFKLRLKYRNQADPTTFWVCVAVGQDPVLEDCPPGTVFILARQSCISRGLLPDLSLGRFDRSWGRP